MNTGTTTQSAPRPATQRAAQPVIADEAVAFQPDADEVEMRAPPRGVRLTLYVLLGLLIAAVTWSAVAEVDRIVVAPGKLVTAAPTLVVQPLETSVIRTIEVAVGERVRAGQVLATLDPTFTAADVGQLTAQADALSAERDRLRAEVAGGDYVARVGPDRELPTAEERLQARIHVERMAEYRAKMAVYDEAIARLSGNIEAHRRERALLVERLEGIREIENIRATLYDQKQGSKLNLLEARDARLSVESDIASRDREVADLGHELAGQKAQRAGYRGEWLRTAADQLADVTQRHAGVANQLDKALRRNAMVNLTAPADAVVLEVAKRSVGSVVREAEALFTLVPLDVPLEAEVNIDTRDIGHVRDGAVARIKVDAFPFQRHGMLPGTVRTISEDAFPGEAGKEPPHYLARLRLEATRLDAVPDNFRLLPGMTVTGEITAGRRTVLSYLLYPLMRGLDESLREP